jgi:hypothetical protein
MVEYRLWLAGSTLIKLSLRALDFSDDLIESRRGTFLGRRVQFCFSQGPAIYPSRWAGSSQSKFETRAPVCAVRSCVFLHNLRCLKATRPFSESGTMRPSDNWSFIKPMPEAIHGQRTKET